MMRSRTALPALVLLPLFLAACGGDTTPDPEPAQEAAPAPAEQPVEDPGDAAVPLGEMNDSGVTGEAMAMHTEDAVVIVVEVTGLPGAGEYMAHIHNGNCADGGGVAAPLNPVIGLADGTGSSTTTLELDDLPADDPHFLMVHGEGGTPIACGDVEGHGD